VQHDVLGDAQSKLSQGTLQALVSFQFLAVEAFPPKAFEERTCFYADQPNPVDRPMQPITQASHDPKPNDIRHCEPINHWME
jgi:hypothetical protein